MIFFSAWRWPALVFSTLLTCSLLTSGCASTTQPGAVGVERKQFLLISSDQANQGAATFYAQEKSKYARAGALNQNPQQTARVREIASHLIDQAGTFRPDTRHWQWEVNVIASKELNAYCAAGGKIAVYSGLIDSLHLTDAEIAAVMGHEISHALREHTREAMSEAMAEQVGVTVLALAFKLNQSSAGLLGNAATVGLTLPFSREKEREADRIGLELMARAGYDPHAAISVWQKMLSSGNARPPQILSTHPDPENRIQNIEAHLPYVMPLYDEAKRKIAKR
jgi:predicted Zn-dependent protease